MLRCKEVRKGLQQPLVFNANWGDEDCAKRIRLCKEKTIVQREEDCAKRLNQSGRVFKVHWWLRRWREDCAKEVRSIRKGPQQSLFPLPWCNLQEQPQKTSDIALSTHLFSFFLHSSLVLFSSLVSSFSFSRLIHLFHLIHLFCQICLNHPIGLFHL